MKPITALRRLIVTVFSLSLFALLFGLSEPAGAVRAPVSSGGEPRIYLPVPDVNYPVYFPIQVYQAGQPIPLANGSFEADTSLPCNYFGFTDRPKGNQHPSGWTFYSPAAGQPLPFPTKMQMGNVVPAISGGPGEYVHKCSLQLPDNEHLGQPRALILDGNWTYKAFNFGNPQALVLSQALTGTPGTRLQVTGYILGETPDHPSGTNTKLEDDHFIGSVQLGSDADTRFYATMIQHNDVPGNERHWNEYAVSDIVPPSGQLTLTIIMQQNWAGETDFFIDNFSAVQWQTN